VLSNEPSEGRSARPGAGESRSEPRRYEGASPDRAPAGRFERQAPERAAPPGRSAPERTAPERSAPPERRPPDADRGRPEAGSASGYVPRTYAAPNYSSAPVERSAPRESSGDSYSAPNYSSTPSDRPSHSREAPSGRSFAGSSGWGAAPTYGGGSGRATVIHPGGMPSGRSAAPSSGGSPSISRGAPSARSAPRSNGAGGGVLRRGDH
jgi:hypothetical protein